MTKSTPKTFAQAQIDSRRALADRGGKLIQIRLEADAVAALAALRESMGFTCDREAIAYALLQAGEPKTKKRRSYDPKNARLFR